MTEGDLKSQLMEVIRDKLPLYMAFRLEDQSTSGIPDISVTGYKRTSWIEVKHANPELRSIGRQDLTMVRLAQTGYAFHVIYQEERGVQRTLIVDPRRVIHWRGEPNHEWQTMHIAATVGFNHRFVVAHLRSLHEPSVTHSIHRG